MKHRRTWKLVPELFDPETDGLSGVAKPKFPSRWKPRPVEDSCVDIQDNAVKRIAAATLLKAVEDYQAICRGKTIPDTELCDLCEFLVSPYAAALFVAAGIDRTLALAQLAELQTPPNPVLMAAIVSPSRPTCGPSPADMRASAGRDIFP